MGGLHWMVEWRYVLEEHGAQSVMTCGTTAMPPLCAVNWDTLELVNSLPTQLFTSRHGILY